MAQMSKQFNDNAASVLQNRDLIQFCVNLEKPRDAAMRNAGTGFVVL